MKVISFFGILRFVKNSCLEFNTFYPQVEVWTQSYRRKQFLPKKKFRFPFSHKFEEDFICKHFDISDDTNSPEGREDNEDCKKVEPEIIILSSDSEEESPTKLTSKSIAKRTISIQSSEKNLEQKEFVNEVKKKILYLEAVRNELD